MTEVGEDNTLSPTEKQVSLVATKDNDRFKVHSEVASITRRLLAHEAFVESNRREVDGEVVSITGYLPINYVSIGTGGRAENTWGGLVSDGVFNDE